jgi:hypothetical protein
MALLTTYATAGECPEYLAEYYEPEGEGLKLRDGYAVENVTGLKKALGETTTKGKTLEKIVKQYGELEEGTWKFEPKVDPNAPTELSKEIESLKLQLGDKPDVKKMVEEQSKERFEALKAAHEANVAKIVEEKEAAYGQLHGKFRATAVDQAINQAILEADGKGHLLSPHIRQMAELDDDFNLILKGQDGNPLMDTDGKNQSVGSYVSELRSNDMWKDAFNAPKASGGGSAGGAGGGGFDPAGPTTTLQPTEGAAFV